jgi:zinc protease
MSITTILRAVALLALAFVPARLLTAQALPPQVLQQPLPMDPKVRTGTLPNGLTYYIRQNTRPEKRAELRLVVNAGSIVEDDDQRGLAHFLEHTAFNGTANFAKNELVSYLESIGVRFGADLNAYTSFDETVYILPVPTDSAHIVQKAFLILQDWAQGQSFDSAEVAREIGVVMEEWRGRKGAADRMLNQLLPTVLRGSRYAERLPVGTPEGIQGANVARLSRFYRDWYRPDLMAVVAVGDFDPAVIEQLIVANFSGLKAPATPRPRAEPEVPGNTRPLVGIATDPEATASSINLYYKMPATTLRTVGDYRRQLMESLYSGMLNARLAEIAQKPGAPFLGAGAGRSPFIGRATDAFSLAAAVRDGQMAAGLEALLVEARRVDEHGFLASELERQKVDLARSFERAFAERERSNSAQYVDEYVQHFLSGTATPGIEIEFQLVQALLPTISLDEVNSLARSWITDENRVIMAQGPRRDGIPEPTEAELLAAFDRAAAVTVTAYTEQVSDAPLIPALPAPGRIVSERQVPGVGVTELRLSNGVRVLVKPTDFKADEVRVAAYSPGGTSLAPGEDFFTAAQAATVVQLSGIGEFDAPELRKKLAGKAATVAPSIGETSEGLSGMASPRDIETLFQLIHLHFTGARLDSGAFEAFRDQGRTALANRGASPDAVFQDSVRLTLAQYHRAAYPPTVAQLEAMDPRRALAFYRDRFADASDFTFVFVGNVQMDTLRTLAQQYLATLPSTGRQETFRDLGVRPPAGVISKTIRKGTEPKATTVFHFHGRSPATAQARLELSVLGMIAQMRLTETLREQLGGTYSPGAGGSFRRQPVDEYQFQVSYGSSPENVELLSASVMALVDTLRTTGPTAADLDKAREQLVRAREVQLKENAYWLSNISARDQAGEELVGMLDAYDAMVRALTPAMIRDAARRYLDTTNYLRFVHLPEAPPS